MRPDLRILLFGLGAVVALAVVVALTGSGDDAEPGAGGVDGSAAVASTATAVPTTTTAPPPTSSNVTTEAPTTTIEAPTTTTSEPRGPDLGGLEPVEIAQALVVTGLDGPDVAARLRDTVGSPCLGGVFVTESNRNWAPEDDPAAARGTIERIQAAATEAGCRVPPLVATDAELGAIVRVPVDSPAAAPTWATSFGANSYDTAAALYDDVVAYATAMRALGVDVNFGAVGDVDTDPSYFMARSGRTFGSDPAVVTTLSATVVNAHCEAGVAATLKHFPNQGDTPQDPHREVSVSAGGRSLWETTGRLPYVETDAPLVMTGHIRMPDVDPGPTPASMSVPITTGLLRDELGYEGVVVTDDLSTMQGAIAVQPDPGLRAALAIYAGADLVLFVRDTDVPAVVDALVERIETIPAFAESALVSYLRVWELKAALGLVGDVDPTDVPLCP